MESKELINNLKKRAECLENETYQIYDLLMNMTDWSIRNELLTALMSAEKALLTVWRLIDNLESKEARQ